MNLRPFGTKSKDFFFVCFVSSFCYTLHPSPYILIISSFSTSQVSRLFFHLSYFNEIMFENPQLKLKVGCHSHSNLISKRPCLRIHSQSLRLGLVFIPKRQYDIFPSNWDSIIQHQWNKGRICRSGWPLWLWSTMCCVGLYTYSWYYTYIVQAILL